MVNYCVLLLALFVGLTHSWDIVVTAVDRLEFYTNDGAKTASVQLNARNLTAITYDEVHDILLYVDKQSDNDAICAYNITSSMEYKCYIERSGRNIHGLAFDPITEVIFFTDIKERSINWFSLKPGAKNDVNGNLLIKIDNGIPTEIVVDSCRGFIYWINTKRTPFTIERARLNGLEREVVIDATPNWNLDGLAIDHQAQKLYWKMCETGTSGYIYSADFDGKNRESKAAVGHHPGDNAIVHPNTLHVSKEFLLFVSRCSICTKRTAYRFSKPLQTSSFKGIIDVDTTSFIAIATNDKVNDQFKRISECNKALNDYENNNLLKKIAEDYYVGPFCVHGVKSTLNEQSLCKCSPGYTGERCEASVCDNTYCLQGNCSITEEGLPICRCEAGYSGERCEVNLCHRYCLNNGICSLTEEDEPGCECVEEYEGERCEVPVGLNNGDGAQNEGNQPASQRVGICESCKCETDKNKTVSTSSTYCLGERERNLTLSDLLDNWRKHA